MRLMQSHKSAMGRRSERRGSVRKSVGIAPVCLFNKTLFHKKAGGLPSGGRAARSAPPGVRGLRSASPSSSPSVRLSDGARRSPPHPARHRTPLHALGLSGIPGWSCAVSEIVHCGHRRRPGPPSRGSEVARQPTCPSTLPVSSGGAALQTALGARGPRSRLPRHSQRGVKLPPHSPGQGIFAWILHWNLKSTATRKHLFSCPSMIKQVAPRHKEAEFPLVELFSFCCKISNILTFPSDFSLYQSFNGRIISRLLDFIGFHISERSLL